MKMEMNETREMSSEKPSYTVAELQLLTCSFFVCSFLLLCFQHWKLFPHEIEPLWEHDAICDDNFRENLLKCIFASEWNSFQFAVDFNAAACILCCSSICLLIRFSLESFYQICTIFIFNFHMCRQQRWRLRRRISSNKRDERARASRALWKIQKSTIDSIIKCNLNWQRASLDDVMILPGFFLRSRW